MKIKVLLFAYLREIIGSEELEVEIPAGSKGEEIFSILEEKSPEISSHIKYLKLSMNGEYIGADTELLDNSEVAVFPPVSGG